MIDPIAVVANFVDIDDDDDSEKIEGLQYQLEEFSKKVEELFSENQKLRDEICAIEERHKKVICAMEERHKMNIHVGRTHYAKVLQLDFILLNCC